MKVFVISLKRSTERRIKIESSLNNIGINFEFFDAVDGKENNFKYYKKQRPIKTKKRHGYALTRNEIACYASHYSIWEKCIQINEPILVLEDNCEFTDALKSSINTFDELAEKYKFIKLCSIFKRKTKKKEILKNGLEIVTYLKRGSGTQGYILSPEAAKEFIIHSHEFIEAVDDYMEKPWRHGVKTYYFKPNIIRRAEIVSTIGSDRKDKKNLTIYDKLTIELFRLYEQIRYTLYR
ncbi:glycosyltransferase family 25 protein [Psychromonas sp. RZ22]|uniref:glycosyltransferase family 25 protein n=1 Tax=Psychromonas algarum TaxID=2555643 RepID=UPI0010681206|nr:glycosyltransferase family 25 protein [Psychromonas sp. RZ22]TEW56613.1 glycosyltransferase family 25 protein [Psychromonas sp. RZ22]